MIQVEAMGHSVEECHLMVEAFSPETEKAFAQLALKHPDKCACDGE